MLPWFLGAVPSQLPCPNTSRHAETCTTCKSGSTKIDPHSHCAGQKCQYIAQRITIAEILCKYSQRGLAFARAPHGKVNDRGPLLRALQFLTHRGYDLEACMEHWGTRPRKNSEIHIDVSHSRQPLVKGERLVRYEVNTVMQRFGCQGVPSFEVHDCGPLSCSRRRPQFDTTCSIMLGAADTCQHT